MASQMRGFALNLITRVNWLQVALLGLTMSAALIPMLIPTGGGGGVG